MRTALITIFSVLIVDQIIKIYIKTHFALGESVEVFSWFNIHFIENKGMAFGYELGGSGSNWGKLFLSLFRVAAIIGLAWYLRKLVHQNAPKLLLVAIGLIFSGAFGNIIDSMFYGLIFSESHELQVAAFMPAEGGYAPFLFGNVVDMFSFSFFPPIFNFADSAITIGVALLILKQKSFFGKKEEDIQSETNLPSDAPSESSPTTEA